MEKKELVKRLREVFGGVIHLDRDDNFLVNGKRVTHYDVDSYVREKDTFDWGSNGTLRSRLGLYRSAFKKNTAPLVYLESLGEDVVSPSIYLRNTLGIGDDGSITKFKWFLQGALKRAYNPGIEFPYMFVLLSTKGSVLRFFYDLFPVGFMCPDRVEFYDSLFVNQWAICFNQFRFSGKQYPLLEQFITRVSDRSGKIVYPRQFVVCGTTTRRDFANGIDASYFVTIEAFSPYTPYLHGVNGVWSWVKKHQDSMIHLPDSPHYSTESMLDRVVYQFLNCTEYPVYFNSVAHHVWNHFPQYSTQEIMDSIVKYLGHPSGNDYGSVWTTPLDF